MTVLRSKPWMAVIPLETVEVDDLNDRYSTALNQLAEFAWKECLCSGGIMTAVPCCVPNTNVDAWGTMGISWGGNLPDGGEFCGAGIKVGFYTKGQIRQKLRAAFGRVPLLRVGKDGQLLP